MSWPARPNGWTAQQDELLRTTLANVCRDEASRQLSLIGPPRSPSAVSVRRHHLGLYQRTRWTPEQRETLRRMWPRNTPGSIADAMDLSLSAVARMAAQMKLGPKYQPAAVAPPGRRAVTAGDPFELNFVVTKRAARVPWAHIARMLRKNEADLRGLYGG